MTQTLRQQIQAIVATLPPETLPEAIATLEALRDRDPQIIRTERGLTIAGTRITLYDVLDYRKAQYSPQQIQDLFNLSTAQINAAIDYIAAHPQQVETEYQDVLKTAAELERHYRAQEQQRTANRKAQPPKPELAAAWQKLQAQKAQHQQQSA